MAPVLSLVTLALLGLASAQTPGTTKEVHPKLRTYKCTKRGGCVARNTAVVLDGQAHPIHQPNSTIGCGSWGSGPNATACPDEATCAKNCIVEGISDYSKYGVTTSGNALHLDMLKNGVSVSPRVYLLAEGEKQYEMLKLTGNELSFDTDVSKLPCGMNGALYLSEMSATGGQSKLNTGGAAYGSGYCDAQCFVTPFVNGVGNIAAKGACCNEMDIWEANARAQSIAPHTCNQTGLYQCTGDECKFDGVCDQWGCSYNAYGLGNPNYYGNTGQMIDTKKPMTVVTQFPVDKNGTLSEIRRLYVQNGKVFANARVNLTDTKAFDSINTEYCSRPGGGHYMDLGGMKAMGGALSRGMVLVFSVWWDQGGFMNWLDSGNSGPCNATEGDPAVIVKVEPNPAVTFSNIKWGEINSTYTGATTSGGYGGY